MGVTISQLKIRIFPDVRGMKSFSFMIYNHEIRGFMFRFSIVMSYSFFLGGSYGFNIVLHTLEVQATIKE